MKRASKAIVMIAVALSIGLHWVVLQSVAWVGMFVDYSADYSIAEAIDRTFDAENKCDLCKMVADGTQSGEDAESAFKTPQLKGISDAHSTVVGSPVLLEFGLIAAGLPGHRLVQPPTPPPPVA